MRIAWIIVGILSAVIIFFAGYGLRASQTNKPTIRNVSVPISPSPVTTTTPDPILESVTPDHGSILHQTLILHGENFSDNMSVQLIGVNASGLYAVISTTSKNSSTISFNPCDNRTTAECQTLQDNLGTEFDIMVQRSTDGRRSDTIRFTIPTASPSS